MLLMRYITINITSREFDADDHFELAYNLPAEVDSNGMDTLSETLAGNRRTTRDTSWLRASQVSSHNQMSFSISFPPFEWPLLTNDCVNYGFLLASLK